MDLGHHYRVINYRLLVIVNGMQRSLPRKLKGRLFCYRIISVVFCLIFFANVFASVDVKDSTGSLVKLNKPAVRILSLAPNVTEILFEIGAGNQIIGRDKYSDYPRAVNNIPIVSDYFRLNLEFILAMKPDLIVLEDSSYLKRDCQRLKQADIAVYINKANSLSSIVTTFLNLGILTGHEQVAKDKAKQFQEKIEKLTSKYLNARKMKVFYELWDNPLLTVNKNTIINEAIELCGGQNICASLPTTAPNVSMESVIRRNPDVIITSYPRAKLTWEACEKLSLIKKDQFFYLPPVLIERTGPRIVQGIGQMCEFIDVIRQKTALNK